MHKAVTYWERGHVPLDQHQQLTAAGATPPFLQPFATQVRLYIIR